MIFPTLKASFVHIPKTGGTSITAGLRQYSSPRFRAAHPQDTGFGHQGTWHWKGEQHSSFSSALNKMPDALKKIVCHHDILCVLRDPYDWFYSIFDEFYSTQKRAPAHFITFCAAETTLERFLDYIEAGDIRGLAASTQKSYVDGVPETQLCPLSHRHLERDLNRFLVARGQSAIDLEHRLNRGVKRRQGREHAKLNPRFLCVCNNYLREDFELLDKIATNA